MAGAGLPFRLLFAVHWEPARRFRTTGTLATTDYISDRGLPASVDAERSILGAILLDNHTYNQAAELLRPDDFSLDSHRRIYAAIMELSEGGRPVDSITLIEELNRKKEVEAVGGVAYLSSLTDGLPHRPNIEQYARIVRDKALLRRLIHAANGAIARAVDQSDPTDEILGATEAAMLELAQDRVTRTFATIPEIMREHFGSLDALYERGQRITGLETYYPRLDEMTCGLQPSDLVIIAARPSMGKTAFALNIAQKVAVLGGKKVVIFSLEMSKQSLLLRLLSSQAEVSMHDIARGFLPRKSQERITRAYSELANAQIYIDDTPGLSLHEMRAKARRLHQQGKIDLIVVDYLQLMSGGGKRYENRTQEVSAISRGLKGLAKELEAPLIALSQLSRAPETRGGDHTPQLSDLRESGSIEQDADVVAFIFRPEVYMKAEDAQAKGLEGEAEIHIAKQRNGPTGVIHLKFRKAFTRFDWEDPGAPESEMVQ